MYLKTALIFSFFSLNAYALVSGPSTPQADEQIIIYSNQAERGKVEPNENRNSFQSADIQIQRLNYSHGIKDFLGLDRSHIFVELGQFKSAKEQVGATLFYDEDSGDYVNIGFSADLSHHLDRNLGFYFNYSLARNYNKEKFSNPRLDQFAFGFTTAAEVTENIFHKTLLHFGSGDSKAQNSYLAADIGFGYKLNLLLGRLSSFSTSVFLEADTAERFDAKYDVGFSPVGTQDRIRAFKYGTVIAFETELTKALFVGATHLQKLGGYDARSTQITSFQVGYKF
jgi:hypothetical protein